MLLLATQLTSCASVSPRCYAQCVLAPLQFPVAHLHTAATPRTEAGRLAEYRLLSKKGEGTFSEVLKAQCLRTAKYVAIKGAPALHRGVCSRGAWTEADQIVCWCRAVMKNRYDSLEQARPACLSAGLCCARSVKQCA